MPRDLISSDIILRNIKPGDKRKRISDGDGLYLLLFVKGGSHGWRFDYSVHGKRKTLSLGTYPDTGLKLARDKAATARQLVAAGVDPSANRKVARAQFALANLASKRADAGLPVLDSFEDVAREWFNTRRDDWAASYGDKIIRRLEVDVFPWIGRTPVEEVTPPQLLTVLRRIESRGVVETAHRALENCGQVFRFAVATGKAVSNPARDLKDALRKPTVRHFPAITDPLRLSELLRACDAYQGTHVVRAALRLLPMVLLRPGELRLARWGEFDLDAGVWTVPAARMKREKAGKLHGKPHVVPLATQAVAALRDLAPLTSGGEYVFRGERHHDRPMSDAAINAAFRAMGFGKDEVTAHGFRATARTIMAERLGMPESVIEAQLAHAVKDSLGRAYNRTEFQAERSSMMQTWADYLDRLRRGAEVIALPISATKQAAQAA
ncbi:integrase arm-type DNA-binding domain-containing protein [Variovorax sp. EL159]|uniref:tyrosine-type recombinase/integrase n=1 Tax=Variovorax sp. EL159 TaxID=1566270 RepID=UPI000887EADF|nr:integrase arm-type DNA-binding domain-containing protein [Variovorax sp. EL159]SCX72647.1 Integrase [Variovorax sp. EL159]